MKVHMGKVRRRTALLAVICLLAACLPLGAAADEPGALDGLALAVSVGEVSGREGEQVTVPVTFSHSADYALTGGSVTVTYDPAALRPVAPVNEAGEEDWEAAAGEALQYAVCQVDTGVSGRLTISFVSAGTLTACEGTLMDLCFEVLARTAGRSLLQVAVGQDVTAVRLSDREAASCRAARTTDGAVVLAADAAYRLGDVNGDGFVDTGDARQVLQYAAELLDADDLDLKAADVNGDGTVDTGDARLMLQYAAEIITKFPAEEVATEPTEPAEPSNPTTPTDPTEPTEPSNPTTPADPTEPTEPSEPTDPAEPSEPTKPTAPPDSTDPLPVEPPFEDATPDPAVGASPDNVGYAFLDENAVPDKEQAEEKNVFKSFLLCREDNEQLPYNVALYISRGYKAATALVPSGTDLTALVPRFRYDGTVTTPSGREIRSGVDALDFSQKFQLVLTAPDGRQTTMVIKVMTLETGLPAFTMTTGDLSAVDSKTEYKPASFTLGGGDSDRCFYANDQTVTVTGQVKGRGNTSWSQDKKSYTLKFDSKRKLLDMDSSKDWVLVAGHEDYSLLRNVMGQYLGELAGVSYTLKARPVDLWYNGAYWGTYSLIQKIEIEGSRVDITKYEEGCAIGGAGYLLEFDGHVAEGDFEANRENYRLWVGEGYEVYYNEESDELFFPLSIGGKWLTIKKPSYTKYLMADPGQIRYIYDYVYQAMDALKHGSYQDICRYIDVESFTNWYIVEEFMNNCDSSFHSSCYMTLDVGGKLKMGPVWDFDRSSDNCDYWNAGNEADYLYQAGSSWFKLLYQHEEARAVLKQRWKAFYTATADIGKTVDEWNALVHDSADQNFRRWAVLGASDGGSRNRRVGSNTEKVLTTTTYDGQVTILRNYLTNHRQVMNRFITSL